MIETPFGNFEMMAQEAIAALKKCPCGGELRDEEVRSKNGAISFRQCRDCLKVYVLRLLVPVEL